MSQYFKVTMEVVSDDGRVTAPSEMPEKLFTEKAISDHILSKLLYTDIEICGSKAKIDINSIDVEDLE